MPCYLATASCVRLTTHPAPLAPLDELWVLLARRPAVALFVAFEIAMAAIPANAALATGFPRVPPPIAWPPRSWLSMPGWWWWSCAVCRAR